MQKRSFCLPLGNEARDGIDLVLEVLFLQRGPSPSRQMQIKHCSSKLVIAMNVLKTKNLVEVKLLLTKENSCFSAFIEKGCYMETGDHPPLFIHGGFRS